MGGAAGGGGGEGAWGAPPPPFYNFFQTALPPSKLMPLPMGHTPHLKMKPLPYEKQTPPLKHEAPFHEMIPRKSTINNNKI